MQLTDRLDVRATLARANKSDFTIGIVLMTVVPLVLLGLGWLLSRSSRGFMIVAEIAAALSLFIGFAAFWSARSEKQDPGSTSALHWKELGAPDQLVTLIEDDWNKTRPDAKFRYQSWYLTPNWLLQMDDMTFETVPLACVVWAYYSTKAKFVNGVPVGTSRTIVINRNDTFTTTVPVSSDDDATEFLFALQERVPWAFYGYTADLYRGWKYDKPGLINLVHQRHEQFKNHQLAPERPTTFAAATDPPSSTA